MTSQSAAEREEDYNDFLYWRLDRPSLDGDVAMPSPPRSPAQEPPADQWDQDDFNDFNYWRQPPPMPISEAHVECADQSQPEQMDDGDCPDSPAFPRMGAPTSVSRNREWLEVETADDEDDEYDEGEEEVDPMAMLTGGAGARLLGLLGQLSQHLGSQSRFARAAGVLQADMQQQREQLLAQQAQVDAHPTAGLGIRQGSTLEQPEVLSSVSSLLSILNAPADPGLERLQPPAPTPAQPLLFEPADASMLPPSPASPAAVSTLSPPCPRFGLELKSEACAICLESLEEAEGTLQMPCAHQHVFHKACLLTWLESRNTCPTCRHAMPTCEEMEASTDEAARLESELAERTDS